MPKESSQYSCYLLDNGIKMKLSEDGSGCGATMVAAVAHQLKNQS